MSFLGCSEGGLEGPHWGFPERPVSVCAGAQGQADALQRADTSTGPTRVRAPVLPPVPAPGSKLAFCSLSPTFCLWETGVAILPPPWLVGRVESENSCKVPGVKAPAPTSELS